MWKELNKNGLTSLKMCVSPVQILLFWTLRNIVDGHISSLGDLCGLRAHSVWELDGSKRKGGLQAV